MTSICVVPFLYCHPSSPQPSLCLSLFHPASQQLTHKQQSRGQEEELNKANTSGGSKITTLPRVVCNGVLSSPQPLSSFALTARQTGEEPFRCPSPLSRCLKEFRDTTESSEPTDCDEGKI
ncbi:unnamed protein product [Hymenolepis diminuta]|uniref:Uncharacterized protein n=1 Tax=Hymenolepis diminuta TaxID=6216 RepID=A0A0R3SA01_HYMDI|nr:unnamed protein product [Hymenolepis diminuta]